MADAWRYADITGFESVSVGGKTALLRLSADASPSAGSEGPRPLLVADDGDSVFRYVAIPAPPDSGGELRAAYSVPGSLITPDTVFSLEFDDDYVISLPEPTAGAARVNRREPPPPPVIAPPATRDAVDPMAELGPAAVEEPGNDPAATGAFGTSDPAGDALDADTEDRRTDMPRQVAALAAEVADTRRENSELRAVAEQTVATGRDLREALLHQHVVLAETNAELIAMRDLSAALPAHQGPDPSGPPPGGAESELEALREQIRLMTLDREEQERQASAYDGVAVKARERATEAEAEAHRASSRLAELEIWSAELERRLAEATTELADARATAEHHESELRRLRGQLAEAHAQAELDRAALGRAGVETPEPASPTAGAEPASPAGETSPAGPTARPASLPEIGEAAVAEAHARAERDLADAAS